jgi:hypothetical protein
MLTMPALIMLMNKSTRLRTSSRSCSASTAASSGMSGGVLREFIAMGGCRPNVRVACAEKMNGSVARLRHAEDDMPPSRVSFTGAHRRCDQSGSVVSWTEFLVIGRMRDVQ